MAYMFELDERGQAELSWRCCELHDALDHEEQQGDLIAWWDIAEEWADDCSPLQSDNPAEVCRFVDDNLRLCAVMDHDSGRWCGIVAEFLGEARFVGDRFPLAGEEGSQT